MDWARLTHDFKQKYEGTWCRIVCAPNPEPEVCFITIVEKGEQEPYLHLHSEINGGILLKYNTHSTEIDFSFPPVGLFQHNQEVFSLTKPHRRQWCKGPAKSTLTCSPLYESFGQPQREISSQLLTSAFKIDPILSLQQGIDLLYTDGKLAQVLSRELAIGLSPRLERNELILWYLTTPVGKVDVETRKIFVMEANFKQEILDFISSTLENHGGYSINS